MLSARSEASRSTVQDLSAVSILVVDDDPDMRSLIRSALMHCRCENIMLSGKARDALQLFGTSKIDLVILDWMMRPMSGCEFLRELRRPERAIGAPVIVLSAGSEPRDVAMAQQFIISGWLTKPIALPELIYQISSVLALPTEKFTAEPDFAADVERLTERYPSKLADDLRLLESALAAMQQPEDGDGSSWPAAEERASTWAMVDRIIRNIRRQAGSFGFGLITSIAALGQEMTQPLGGNAKLVHRYHVEAQHCVVALVRAMRLVLQNGIRGDGGAVGERLLLKLRNHTALTRSRLVADYAPT